jgi:hypothetical protein
MIERHAMADAAATIVTDDGKAIEPEVAHHFHLVETHRTLGVICVVLSVRRLAAVAVSTQIRGDHGVGRGELRRHDPPRDVRLWGAVQEQHRRSRSPNDAVDRRARCLERERLEAGKEFRRRRC